MLKTRGLAPKREKVLLEVYLFAIINPDGIHNQVYWKYNGINPSLPLSHGIESRSPLEKCGANSIPKGRDLDSSWPDFGP